MPPNFCHLAYILSPILIFPPLPDLFIPSSTFSTSVNIYSISLSLKSFHPHLPQCFLSSWVRLFLFLFLLICRCIHQDWIPDSAFWLVVVLCHCNGRPMLQGETFLMKGEDYTCLRTHIQNVVKYCAASRSLYFQHWLWHG